MVVSLNLPTLGCELSFQSKTRQTANLCLQFLLRRNVRERQTISENVEATRRGRKDIGKPASYYLLLSIAELLHNFLRRIQNFCAIFSAEASSFSSHENLSGSTSRNTRCAHTNDPITFPYENFNSCRCYRTQACSSSFYSSSDWFYERRGQSAQFFRRERGF